MIRTYLLCLLAFALFGCGSGEEEHLRDTLKTLPVAPPSSQYTYQVFDITDSAGDHHGVGYDIMDNGKKIIHQVNIPGEPGNDGFVTADEAERVAKFVVEKLNAAGGFPTVTHEELEQMGITLQSN